MRLCLALEVGRRANPYTVQRSEGWLKSAVLYVGGETPLGPVYLGAGAGLPLRHQRLPLFIGTR